MFKHLNLSVSHPQLSGILLLVSIFLAAFLISTSDLRRDSLWNDEAWTAWAIQPTYLRDTLERVREDVHPPLYFLLLNLWTRAAGDSAFALRLPSALFGMIGLAATYTVSKQLFDSKTGIIALVVLGTASFFVYYSREARMYMLLLALAALSMLLYLRWRDRPTWRRMIIYSVSMAMLLYTHYAGALVIATQVLHLLFTLDTSIVWQGGIRFTAQRTDAKTIFKHILQLISPYALTLVLFIPWLPIFLNQMKANPNGPLAIPVPTDWVAAAALILILTSGNWLLFIVPFVVSSAISQIRFHANAIVLVVFWLLLTPIALLALNAWITPVYQVRYAIAMLPAGALLLAYGLRYAGLPEKLWNSMGVWTPTIVFLRGGLIALLLVVIAYTQLTIYPELWAAKPPWQPIIQQMVTTRQPLEPTITDLAPYSPAAYYDRHLHIRQGVSLDLSWRLHSAEETLRLADIFKNEPSVWVALPVNTAKTWEIVTELDKTRHIGYRSSLINMIFYRFDMGDSNNLQFRFGDLLRYVGGASADQQLDITQGRNMCINVHLKTLDTLDGSYSAGLHLVDLTGTTNIAGWDGGLGTAEAGKTIDLAPCMTIPAEIAPGHYHLELVVYNWSNLERLPLIEDGAGEGLEWQNVLMLAAVDVLSQN